MIPDLPEIPQNAPNFPEFPEIPIILNSVNILSIPPIVEIRVLQYSDKMRGFGAGGRRTYALLRVESGKVFPLRITQGGA